MSSIARLRPVCVFARLARSAGRALVFALHVLIVGASMGLAPPSLVVRMPRHDDPVVQVDDEDAP
jgi:hypothetical protein